MFKIQTLNKISQNGLDLMPHENFEYASEIGNPDGIILRSFKMHDMELPHSLKAIARAGAGVNNIPIEKCSEKGVVVFNTPGANANGVKELVLLGLLISSRKVFRGIKWAKNLSKECDDVSKTIEKGKSDFSGQEIKGKKLGVIGLGAIGVMVANDAESLGMEVSGYDPFMSVDAAWGLSRSVIKAVSFDSIISDSDYISIHIPLNDKTKGIFNKEKFKFRIFATDKCDEQINKARIGKYSISALNNINLKREKKWFTKQKDIYTIKPELMENISM